MPEGDRVRSAAEAFQALSDEFRVAILDELARRDDPPTFTDLRSALDDPDSVRHY
jgi:DNA-binding transcriptional ArsR family regulator